MYAFPSIWGHWAGGPGDSKEDVKWLDNHLKEFFESEMAKPDLDTVLDIASVSIV